MKYDFDFFESIAKSHESEKRFKHTLGVQKEAYKLGSMFMPHNAEKLRLAGLLHDITKDFPLKNQLDMCHEYGIEIDESNIVPKLLHAKTGAEYSRRTFGADIIDDEIYNGIYYHTTGCAGMSLFDSIIYLADYIEEGRTFEDCIVLRNYFYNGVSEAASDIDKLEILRKTMVMSFDLTIKNLIDEAKEIDKDTINARNYFLKNDYSVFLEEK